MSVKLVVFDIAGTTLYDNDAVNRALQSALAAVGVDVSKTEVDDVMGIAKPTAIELLLKSGNDARLSPDFVAQIHADFVQRMLAYYETSPEVVEIEGVSDTFKRLKANGIKVSLDTGFSRDITDRILARTGWAANGLVDATATSDEVAQGRPYPDLIFKLMKDLSVESASAVLKAGDTPVDLAEGMAAGCAFVVGVTSGSFTREQLAALPHTHILNSVNDVPALLNLQ